MNIVEYLLIVKNPADGHVMDRFHSAGESMPSLEDPVLRKLAQDLVLGTDQTIVALSELVSSESVHDTTDVILDQAKVDNLTIAIVGEESLEAAQTASELFVELDKLTKDDDGGSTLLTEGVGALIFADPSNRHQARRTHGPHLARCRRLVDFWEEHSPTLTPAHAEQIFNYIVSPVRDMTEYRVAVIQQDPVQLESVREVLLMQDKIDTATKLGMVKFLVASSIVDIYKQEAVVAACRKISDDESVAQVNNSAFGPYYWASHVVADLKTEEYEKHLRAETSVLQDRHSRGRFMNIPSRKFRDTMASLRVLGNLYIGIEGVENVLKNLPTQVSGMRDLETSLIKFQAGELVADALRLYGDSYDSMITVQDAKHQQASDVDGKHSVWEEAMRFDEIIVKSASTLAICLDEFGIQIDPNYRRLLEEIRLPKLSMLRNDLIEQARVDALKAAADIASKELLAIDGLYVLPNKRFRERAPELIGLAKVLSESLNDHEPLAEQDARALVGLMLGVYWERTGKDAPVQDLAMQYLEDAEEIRGLTAKIESLGYSQDSQLLRMVNLLDELIDSGLFDNTKKHPELKIFEDFILAYIIAKDKDQQPQLTQDTDDTDEPPSEPIVVPVIPVETIGQAVYEDIKVFPPSSTKTEVISDYVEGISEKDMPSIEWERIKKLIELRDQFAKQSLEVQLIRTKHASWQVLPFFVLEVKLPDSEHGVAVVESPVYGNATYIYREARDRLTWRDVVQLERQEARDLGAIAAVHVDSKKLDTHFKKLWNRVISELTIAQ